VLDEQFAPALGEFDLDFEEILGLQMPWAMWGFAFEDFLTRTGTQTGLWL